MLLLARDKCRDLKNCYLTEMNRVTAAACMATTFALINHFEGFAGLITD